jgi:diacylglycerol kinase (ATP)
MTADKRKASTSARMCHVIMNAAAGRAHRDRLALALRAGLPRWPITLHAPQSTSEMHGVIRAIPLHEDLVIAGGDGTLQCALQVLMETQHPVVVLPLGTANDFANHWGYSPDVLSLQAALTRRVLRQVDVLSCNGVNFITVGGLGVGAFLTRDFNKARKFSPLIKMAAEAAGSSIYTALAAGTILGRRAYLRHYEIESSGGSFSGLFSNVFVCNQPRLGGNLLVAPHASTSDGCFDILFLKAKTPFDLLRSLAAMRVAKEPILSERLITEELVVRASDGQKQLFFADGEAFEMDSLMRFKIYKGALSLLTAGGLVA